MVITGEAAVNPPRRILGITGPGRSTCATPILEICKILHERGHEIEFALLAGEENMVKNYPFVKKVHIIGRSIDPEEDRELYTRFDTSNTTTLEGKKGMLKSMMFFQSFFPEVYRNLKEIVRNQRPDFIFADWLTEAALDMIWEERVPVASLHPQMPWHMVPQKGVPGLPGLQLQLLSSENASLGQRMYENLTGYMWLYALKEYLPYRSGLRRKAGAKPYKRHAKPFYLCFINSFFGMEIPKDLPPLLTPIGPVLSESWPPLGDLESFMTSYKKIIYIGFGTHVDMLPERIKAILQALHLSIQAGNLDGVIWAMKMPTKERQAPVASSDDVVQLDYEALFKNENPAFHFTSWAPQRAILDHPSCRVFLSHCGASSANEAIFHGVPLLAMPNFGDQGPTALRAEKAGVAIRIDKLTFSPASLSAAIGRITTDPQGSFLRNVLRLQRIARVDSRRKFVAADMIEEVLYDHELRFEHSPHDDEWQTKSVSASFQGVGKELRPMHLETADARMGWLKANNYDIYLTLGASILGLIWGTTGVLHYVF